MYMPLKYDFINSIRREFRSNLLPCVFNYADFLCYQILEPTNANINLLQLYYSSIFKTKINIYTRCELNSTQNYVPLKRERCLRPSVRFTYLPTHGRCPTLQRLYKHLLYYELPLCETQIFVYNSGLCFIFNFRYETQKTPNDEWAIKFSVNTSTKCTHAIIVKVKFNWVHIQTRVSKMIFQISAAACEKFQNLNLNFNALSVKNFGRMLISAQGLLNNVCIFFPPEVYKLRMSKQGV